jgi:uncharacterized protein GlcG (DUF336 family)
MQRTATKAAWTPLLLMLVGSIATQTPATGETATRAHSPATVGRAATSVPGRLPGDNPPPRGMLLQPPPVPSPGHPPPDMRNRAPAPSIARALEAARAALAACSAKGQKVGVAVIDSSGQPRAALVADGALGGNVYTAVRKGLAAIAFGEPTSAVSAQLQAHKIQPAQITRDMVPWAGAVPLLQHGKIIGAVAVSGSASSQDEACARAGARAIARSR